jgi:hypothetical protein
MPLPFGREEFFKVFSEYNTTMWPFQIILLAYGALMLIFALTGKGGGFVGGGLGVLWVWMGLMYHVAFFSTINSAALIFGALFVIQGGYFIFGRSHLHFGKASVMQRIVGLVLVAYGVFLYPIVGWYFGQDWPAMPVFSLPCPTTIFTFGVLCLAVRPFPMTMLVIPVLWAAIGTSAAASLDVPEDFGLPVAAVLTLVVLFRERHAVARGALA